MGRQRQIPLVTTTSEGDVSGRESLINVYPRKTTGGKYSYRLVNAPGLAPFINLPTMPVLGLHENGDRAFAVTSTKFYEIFGNGLYIELGDIDIQGIPVLSDNGKQVVVVEYDGEKTGILVDEIIGNIQAVIKPISKISNKNYLFSGSTVLGDGRVALILDINNLTDYLKAK